MFAVTDCDDMKDLMSGWSSSYYVLPIGRWDLSNSAKHTIYKKQKVGGKKWQKRGLIDKESKNIPVSLLKSENEMHTYGGQCQLAWVVQFVSSSIYSGKPTTYSAKNKDNWFEWWPCSYKCADGTRFPTNPTLANVKCVDVSTHFHGRKKEQGNLVREFRGQIVAD